MNRPVVGRAFNVVQIDHVPCPTGITITVFHGYGVFTFSSLPSEQFASYGEAPKKRMAKSLWRPVLGQIVPTTITAPDGTRVQPPAHPKQALWTFLAFTPAIQTAYSSPQPWPWTSVLFNVYPKDVDRAQIDIAAELDNTTYRRAKTPDAKVNATGLRRAGARSKHSGRLRGWPDWPEGDHRQGMIPTPIILPS